VRVKPTHVEDYFDLLLTEKKDFPSSITNSILYLRVVTTSQVEMKRHNRMAEHTAARSRKLSSDRGVQRLPAILPDSRPDGRLEVGAAGASSNDLLDGSGIGPIYVDFGKQYEEVFERGSGR